MKKDNFEIAWQALVQWTRASLFMAIGLSAFRLVLFMVCYQHRVPMGQPVVEAFLAGTRFDILVLGFFWIPVWFWAWGLAAAGKTDWIFQPMRFYWCMSWTLFFFYQVSDLFVTAPTGIRMNAESSRGDIARIFIEGTHAMTGWRTTFALIALFIVFVAVLRRMIALKEIPLPAKFQGPIWFKMFFSLFVVALAARGTITAHHLNIEHAQVSNSQEINQISLNPIWNSDKK